MRHAIVRAAVIGGSAVRLHASHARLQPAMARSLFMGRIASIKGTAVHLQATSVPAPVQPGRGHVAALALVSFQPMCRRMKSTLASPVPGSETAASEAGAPGGAHAAGGVERIEQVEQEEEAKTGSERAIGWWAALLTRTHAQTNKYTHTHTHTHTQSNTSFYLQFDPCLFWKELLGGCFLYLQAHANQDVEE